MMAYDRYDTRDAPRGEHSRWRDERSSDNRYANDQRRRPRDERNSSGRDERGFFERAGDEIASWFGDEDAERRRRRDEVRDRGAERGSSGGWGNRDRDYDRGYGRDFERDRNAGYGGEDWNDERSAFSRHTASNRGGERGHSDDREQDRGHGHDRSEDWNDNRGAFARGGSSERDYNRDWRQEYAGRDFNPRQADRERDRGWTDRYRPMTGDYGRSDRQSAGRNDDYGRSQSKWAEDEYRGTSRAGSANWSDKSREEGSNQASGDRFDPHYRSWRDRHLSELDRDYDDFRAENQSRFESDFGGWRERRQQKRGLLGRVREHMEVVGSDQKHVGTVDKTAGDRLVLAKSDPESGGMHHSISCSDIDRIEGDKVILDCTADQARNRWQDESRGRALFERDDQGEMGPRTLDRSFKGTYR